MSQRSGSQMLSKVPLLPHWCHVKLLAITSQSVAQVFQPHPPEGFGVGWLPNMHKLRYKKRLDKFRDIGDCQIQRDVEAAGEGCNRLPVASRPRPRQGPRGSTAHVLDRAGPFHLVCESLVHALTVLTVLFLKLPWITNLSYRPTKANSQLCVLHYVLPS
jgi:hypothetical protein